MHLKPATSTHIQPHNEPDMAFSMHLHSGERSCFLVFSQPVIIDLGIPVKSTMKLIHYFLRSREIKPVFIFEKVSGKNK